MLNIIYHCKKKLTNEKVKLFPCDQPTNAYLEETMNIIIGYDHRKHHNNNKMITKNCAMHVVSECSKLLLVC